MHFETMSRFETLTILSLTDFDLSHAAKLYLANSSYMTLLTLANGDLIVTSFRDYLATNVGGNDKYKMKNKTCNVATLTHP